MVINLSFNTFVRLGLLASLRSQGPLLYFSCVVFPPVLLHMKVLAQHPLCVHSIYHPHLLFIFPGLVSVSVLYVGIRELSSKELSMSPRRLVFSTFFLAPDCLCCLYPCFTLLFTICDSTLVLGQDPGLAGIDPCATLVATLYDTL